MGVKLPQAETDPRPLWVRHYPEIEHLVADATDSFDYWSKKFVADEHSPEYNYARARAYISHDGFYHFCFDIMGFKDMHEPLHRDKICKMLADPKQHRTLLQVNRGSFKSSIATIGYSAWLVARTLTLTPTVKCTSDAVGLQEVFPPHDGEFPEIFWPQCNIRILIGSEVLQLSNAFCSSVNRTLHHNPKYHKWFGKHRQDTPQGRLWKDNAITSQFRTQHDLKEPTVSTLSTGAPRSGFHYDAVLVDDLQAERTSSNQDQIDAAWDFFQLLHSLREPTWADNHPMWTVLPAGPRFGVTGTRWHFDDIYQRIESEDARRPEDDRMSILYSPVIDKDGEPTFPNRFNMETIEKLRIDHGPEIFASQYLLDPTPQSLKPFKRAWITRTSPDIIAAPSLYGRVALGSDWAWTAKTTTRRGGRGSYRKADYTVHLAGCINPKGDIFVTHYFRGRVTPHVGIEELFKLYEVVKAREVGLQKFDQVHIEDLMKRISREKGQYINATYISYPSKEAKHARIKNVLQTLFERRKIFLPADGFEWLEAELLDFPSSLTFDGLDALCNLCKILIPKVPSNIALGRGDGDQPIPDTTVARKVLGLRKNGTVTDLQGRPIGKPRKPTY